MDAMDTSTHYEIEKEREAQKNALRTNMLTLLGAVAEHRRPPTFTDISRAAKSKLRDELSSSRQKEAWMNSVATICGIGVKTSPRIAVVGTLERGHHGPTFVLLVSTEDSSLHETLRDWLHGVWAKLCEIARASKSCMRAISKDEKTRRLRERDTRAEEFKKKIMLHCYERLRHKARSTLEAYDGVRSEFVQCAELCQAIESDVSKVRTFVEMSDRCESNPNYHVRRQGGLLKLWFNNALDVAKSAREIDRWLARNVRVNQCPSMHQRRRRFRSSSLETITTFDAMDTLITKAVRNPKVFDPHFEVRFLDDLRGPRLPQTLEGWQYHCAAMDIYGTRENDHPYVREYFQANLRKVLEHVERWGEGRTDGVPCEVKMAMYIQHRRPVLYPAFEIGTVDDCSRHSRNALRIIQTSFRKDFRIRGSRRE